MTAPIGFAESYMLARSRQCQFGYQKVLYRGIANVGVQVFSLLVLSKLFLGRSRLVSA